MSRLSWSILYSLLSELENEVKHGLMGGKDGSALVMEREITDLSNYTSEQQADAFTEVEWNDVDEKWQQCKDSQQLLSTLKVPPGVNTWTSIELHIYQF